MDFFPLDLFDDWFEDRSWNIKGTFCLGFDCALRLFKSGWLSISVELYHLLLPCFEKCFWLFKWTLSHCSIIGLHHFEGVVRRSVQVLYFSWCSINVSSFFSMHPFIIANPFVRKCLSALSWSEPVYNFYIIVQISVEFWYYNSSNLHPKKVHHNSYRLHWARQFLSELGPPTSWGFINKMHS